MTKSLFESEYVWPPKIGGDPVRMTIVDSKRVELDDPEKCYHNKNKQSMGYRDEFITESGKILPCATWKLYFALRDANVRPGDTIEIAHPGQGEYTVSIVPNPGDIKKDEDMPDYLKRIEKRNGPTDLEAQRAAIEEAKQMWDDA